MGKVQTENVSSVPLPADVASPAVVEVSENIRAKIYAIFSKLGEYTYFNLYLVYGLKFNAN